MSPKRGREIEERRLIESTHDEKQCCVRMHGLIKQRARVGRGKGKILWRKSDAKVKKWKICDWIGEGRQFPEIFRRVQNVNTFHCTISTLYVVWRSCYVFVFCVFIIRVRVTCTYKMLALCAARSATCAYPGHVTSSYFACSC